MLQDFYNLYVSQSRGFVRDYLTTCGIGVWELYIYRHVSEDDAMLAIDADFVKNSLADYPFTKRLSSPADFSKLVSSLESKRNLVVSKHSDYLVTVEDIDYDDEVLVYYLDIVSEKSEGNPVMEGLYSLLIESGYVLDSNLLEYFNNNGVVVYKHTIYECVGGSEDDIDSATPRSVPFLSYYVSYDSWVSSLDEIRSSDDAIISDDGLSYKVLNNNYGNPVIEFNQLEVYSSN